MSNDPIVRKFELQGQLVAYARMFLEHVREHETPSAAIVIPLDEQQTEFIAIGSAQAIAGLTAHDRRAPPAS